MKASAFMRQADPAVLPGGGIRTFDPRLYLVTDRTMLRRHTIEELVRDVASAGVTAIQLREKGVGDREFLDVARRLMEVLAEHGRARGWRPALIINDSVEIAAASDADGLHLGQSDGSAAAARERLGSDRIIGLSVECMEDVIASASAPVDYLGVSPVFRTPTKTDTKGEWGLEGLRALSGLSAREGRPLVAIGGLTIANAPEVIGAGADGIAVVSAICAADDPAQSARDLRRVIDSSLSMRKGGGHGVG